MTQRLILILVVFLALTLHPLAAADATYRVEQSGAAGFERVGTTAAADTAFELAEDTAGQDLAWQMHICTAGDCAVSAPDNEGDVWQITRIEP